MSWRALLPTRRHALWLLLATILLMAPAFIVGPGGFDLHTQSLWSRAFADQFYAGEWYPRWLMSLFAGAGSPAFFYNPPLPFWLMLPFYPLRHYDEFGYAMQAAAAGLSVWLSAFAMHAWLRDVGLDRSAAMAGSLLWMVVPHHLGQNFYTLLLYATVWAYVSVPLMFMYARRLARSEAGGVAGYAISLGMLLLTHTPNSLVFGVLSMVYFLACLPRISVAALARTAAAVVLGFGISAMFLLPCLTYLKFVSLGLGAMPDGTRNPGYSQFFFAYDQLSAHAFEVYWFASALLTAALVRPASKLPQGHALIGMAIAALFLMLPISSFIWVHVPLVKYIQLAARLFFVLALVHVYVLAHAWPRWQKPIILLIGLCTGITIGLALHGREPTYAAFAQANPLRIEGLRMRIEQYPNMLPNEHILMRYGSPEGRAAIRQNNQRAVVFGDGTVEVTQWKPRNIVLKANINADSVVRVRQLWFYGVAATVDGQAVDPVRDDETGFILVPVSAGAHQITVTLEKLLPEKLGLLISFMSLGIWLLMVLVARIRRQTAPE